MEQLMTLTPELYVVNRLEKIEAEFDDFRKHSAITVDNLINERDQYRRQLEAYQHIVSLVASDIEVADSSIRLYVSEYKDPEKYYDYKRYFGKSEETPTEESANESPVTEEVVEETESK